MSIDLEIWVSVAMETHFHVFMLNYQYFETFLEGTLFKMKFVTIFPQYVLKNIACLAVARERNYV